MDMRALPVVDYYLEDIIQKGKVLYIFKPINAPVEYILNRKLSDSLCDKGHWSKLDTFNKYMIFTTPVAIKFNRNKQELEMYAEYSNEQVESIIGAIDWDSVIIVGYNKWSYRNKVYNGIKKLLEGETCYSVHNNAVQELARKAAMDKVHNKKDKWSEARKEYMSNTEVFKFRDIKLVDCYEAMSRKYNTLNFVFETSKGKTINILGFSNLIKTVDGVHNGKLYGMIESIKPGLGKAYSKQMYGNRNNFGKSGYPPKYRVEALRSKEASEAAAIEANRSDEVTYGEYSVPVDVIEAPGDIRSNIGYYLIDEYGLRTDDIHNVIAEIKSLYINKDY